MLLLCRRVDPVHYFAKKWQYFKVKFLPYLRYRKLNLGGFLLINVLLYLMSYF